MSQQYVLEVETSERDDDVADTWIDALAPWHGSVSTGPTGTFVITVSVPAENLAQACATGLAVVSRLAAPAAVTVLPQSWRDEREGWSRVPELVSVAEAADLLGVSRQRVLRMVHRGRQPATRVGTVYGIPRGAIPRGELPPSAPTDTDADRAVLVSEAPGPGRPLLP